MTPDGTKLDHEAIGNVPLLRERASMEGDPASPAKLGGGAGAYGTKVARMPHGC